MEFQALLLLNSGEILGLPVYSVGLPRWFSSKESTCQWRRCGFDSWVGKIPGEGNGNLLEYSSLGNPMDRGTWCAILHGVTKIKHDLATKQHCSLSHTPLMYMADLGCRPYEIF